MTTKDQDGKNGSTLSTSLEEVRTKRDTEAARNWVANYRGYVRKPDSLGNSNHSGEHIIEARFGVDEGLLYDLVSDRYKESLEIAKKVRQTYEDVAGTIGETAAKNFMLYFRERVADVYFVSARRDSNPDVPRKLALHRQPLGVQQKVIETFSRQALEFAAFMGQSGAVLDMAAIAKMARHSPVVYADVDGLIDYYCDLIEQGILPSDARERFFNSPRLVARNGYLGNMSYSHPSLGDNQDNESARPAFETIEGAPESVSSSIERPALKIVR